MWNHWRIFLVEIQIKTTFFCWIVREKSEGNNLNWAKLRKPREKYVHNKHQLLILLFFIGKTLCFSINTRCRLIYWVFRDVFPCVLPLNYFVSVIFEWGIFLNIAKGHFFISNQSRLRDLCFWGLALNEFFLKSEMRRVWRPLGVKWKLQMSSFSQAKLSTAS